MSKNRIEEAVGEVAASRFPSMEVSGHRFRYTKSRRHVETIYAEMIDKGRLESPDPTVTHKNNHRKRKRGPRIITYLPAD